MCAHLFIHAEHDRYLTYMIYNRLTYLLLKLCIARYHDTCDMLRDIISDFIVDILIAVSVMLTCYMHMHLFSFYTFIKSSDSLNLHIQVYGLLYSDD